MLSFPTRLECFLVISRKTDTDGLIELPLIPGMAAVALHRRDWFT